MTYTVHGVDRVDLLLETLRTPPQLDELTRVLIGLAVASHDDIELRWLQQAARARALGISDEQLSAVALGDLRSAQLPQPASVALQAAVEILEDGRPSASTAAAAEEWLSEPARREIALVIGCETLRNALADEALVCAGR